MFIIGVEDDEDQFVTVEQSEEIANRVGLKCDCFTCCMALNLLLICVGILLTMIAGTEELSKDWNVNNDDSVSVFDIVRLLSG